MKCHKRVLEPVSLVTSASPAASSSIRPLTTVFNPPNSCVGDIYRVGTWTYYQSSGTYTSALVDWVNLGPLDPAECLPPGWGSLGYYSPGLCPSGYNVAAENYATWMGGVVETMAICCPALVAILLRNNELS